MRFSLYLFLFIFMISCRVPKVQTNTGKEEIFKTDLFTFQTQHVHGSSLVELPNGDLLAAWYEGSGERWADDVAIMGARLHKGKESWSTPFVLADVPDFPDINPVLFIDQQQQLWLLWYTVLANQWETSILKYRLSKDFQQQEGAPKWHWQDVIHPKPGGPAERGIQEDDPFVASLIRQLKTYDQYIPQTLKEYSPEERAGLLKRWEERKKELIGHARGEDLVARGRIPQPDGKTLDAQLGYPRFRRMGWQTQNKPLFLPSGRMIIPLYSDGFDFSLMAITDDGGKHWTYSEPLVSLGGVQPTLVLRKDGTIVTYMRDNGPPPQRLLTSSSSDNGLSWTPVTDSDIYNPGAGSDMVKMADGRWLLANNDTENGRNSLALLISSDEGKTWKILLHLERDLTEGTAMRAHYPALIQGKNGDIHLTYSYYERNAEGQRVETIRYARVRVEE